LSMICLLSLFGATLMLNLKFLAYANRELWPAGKNDPHGPGRVRKSPVKTNYRKTRMGNTLIA